MKDGGPAFPKPMSIIDAGASIQGYDQEGMTLRDWFAGQAIAGIATACGHQGLPWDTCATEAYKAADAMLKRREKEIADENLTL